MLRILLPLMILLGFSAASLGAEPSDSCEPFRLDQEGRALDPATFSRVVHQGTSQSCYSYALSLLWDAYRGAEDPVSRREGTLPRTDPLEAALGHVRFEADDLEFWFRDSFLTPPFGAGWVEDAFDYLKERGGSCPASSFKEMRLLRTYYPNIESEIHKSSAPGIWIPAWEITYVLLSSYYESNKDGFEKIKDLRHDFRNWMLKEIGSGISDFRVDWLQKKEARFYRPFTAEEKELLEKSVRINSEMLEVPTHQEILNSFYSARSKGAREVLDFFISWLYPSCKPRLVPKTFPTLEVFPPTPRDRLGRIVQFFAGHESVENLKKKLYSFDFSRADSQPVGASFQSHVMKMKEMQTSPLLHHVAVLIGRRMNEATNQCEWLIRNSAGNRCRSYTDEVECDCTHPVPRYFSKEIGTGKKLLRYSNASCSDQDATGSVWIPEDALLDALFQIYRLMPSSSLD